MGESLIFVVCDKIGWRLLQHFGMLLVQTFHLRLHVELVGEAFFWHLEYCSFVSYVDFVAGA